MTWVQLTPEIEQRLNGLAAGTGLSKAYFVREFIMNGLDDLEDIYRANATMERVQSEQEKILDYIEVRKRIGFREDQIG